MNEEIALMRLGFRTRKEEHGESFSSAAYQTRHRLRRMEAIIEQLKAGHKQLNRIWAQAETESGKGTDSGTKAGSKAESVPGSVSGEEMKEMTMEPETQAALMRVLMDLKQNLIAFRRLGSRQIEAVTWPGISVIEEDVKDKEAFLCEFLSAKYVPAKG